MIVWVTGGVAWYKWWGLSQIVWVNVQLSQLILNHPEVSQIDLSDLCSVNSEHNFSFWQSLLCQFFLSWYLRVCESVLQQQCVNVCVSVFQAWFDPSVLVPPVAALSELCRWLLFLLLFILFGHFLSGFSSMPLGAFGLVLGVWSRRTGQWGCFSGCWLRLF